MSNISNRLQNIGKFSGYLSREKFSSIKKSNSFCDLTSQKIESVNIKSKCVFDAAFKDILQQINEDGEVSIEEVISTIQLYQSASDVVKTFFPNSKPSKNILNIVRNELATYGILPDNTLFAQSICPNEINRTNGGIANVFTQYFGDCFHMGGLAGIPFTGSTGFASFSHHVPDGEYYILYLL